MFPRDGKTASSRKDKNLNKIVATSQKVSFHKPEYRICCKNKFTLEERRNVKSGKKF